MNVHVPASVGTLSEKEKQTLRLIVRGHDAKSIARSLDLSVHTINERLRDARRKLAVSSSREAARLLLAVESDGPAHPHILGDAEFGADLPRAPVDQEVAPDSGVGSAIRRPRIVLGVLVMTLALSLVALIAMPNTASLPEQTAAPSAVAPASEVAEAARQWMALVDQGRWDESYRATGASFRKLNTAEVWAAASVKARTPLGAMISRTFIDQQSVPAPPAGYEIVKFRTRFANKAEAIETVSLDREGGAWRVVGVWIE
ncbi:DUF4019 domain-containing protein [Sphingomonas donggukensis]|uniref:DUF4019 domain-containing protein n=1 Tax=Sphingomonas donggukensis TaxID=2949093 RepID=A0ABY4TW47_9SPHN|nr:DUF4019 domain-containing protein [Sphingomonas donggukensis]URW74548.1 DUF4019 domain-containing protein [Sphingomonas donggukensis]